jgi:hypothetical protein
VDTASVHAADGLASRIAALHGTLLPAVHRPAARHAFGAHAAVPYLHSATQVGPGDTYAAAVALTADPSGPGAPPTLTIAQDEDGQITATITWPTGAQNQVTL